MINLLTTLQKYCIYCFFFFIPWHTIFIVSDIFYGTEKWQYGTIGVYCSDIILCIYFIITVLTGFYTKHSFLIQKKHSLLLLCAIALTIWILLSISWAQNQKIALYHAYITLTGISLILSGLFIKTKISLRICMFIFITSMTIHSTYGIIQFTTQSSHSITLLGIQNHIIHSGTTATITDATGRWMRAYGGFPHPNIFAGFLIITLLFLVYLYTTILKKSFLFATYLLCTLTLNSTALFFTGSRSAWIIGFAILFLYITYSIYHQKKTYIYTDNNNYCTILYYFIFLYTIIYCSHTRNNNNT